MSEPTKNTPEQAKEQLQNQQNQPDIHKVERNKQPQRRDGYRETEGPAYGDSHSGYGTPEGGLASAEQGYNPAHSGVQPAKHKPGETINAPGRDTGTAWGEKQQMGQTDKPERNPAG